MSWYSNLSIAVFSKFVLKYFVFIEVHVPAYICKASFQWFFFYRFFKKRQFYRTKQAQISWPVAKKLVATKTGLSYSYTFLKG